MGKDRHKRPAPRDNPHEYLGGDLGSDVAPTASGSAPPNVIDFTLDEQHQPPSKKERNESRKKQNKIWKTSIRLPDSGVDANPRHTQYYRAQLAELAEPQEWQRFQAMLCKKLPVTFRFGHTACSSVRRGIDGLLRGSLNHLTAEYVELDGEVVRGGFVRDIGYFGPAGGLRVYELAGIDSASLASAPQLKRLSDFLLREVALGHLVRQELVSMIPVELADVQAHHRVLDVCAAPGSKTEQLLHALYKSSSDGAAPSGFVVANDADPVRIQTLRRRYARSGSPSLLVTCCRAEELRARLGDGVFDRIVCDVPCSGDGTFRKMPHLWRLFRPRVALELHLLQLQIAAASAHMLRPGGRMVYSTCSINPLEDEAVVAGLLTMFAGSLKLVDVHTRHPELLVGLHTRAGLGDWRCDADIFTAGEPDEDSRAESRRRLPPFTPSMGPPDKQLHLERCLRVLPHDNNTGGFFIAVLEKEGGGAEVRARGLAAPVSQSAALSTLRSLGYNPRSADAAVGPGIRLLGGDEYSSAMRALRLDESKVSCSSGGGGGSLQLIASACEDDAANAAADRESQQKRKKRRADGSAGGSKSSNSGAVLWGSRKDGWRKATPEEPAAPSAPASSTAVGLVSAQLASVLGDWCAAGVLVQAGVRIATAAGGLSGGPLRACCSGLLPLSACMLRGAVLSLSLDSFLLLCGDEDAYFEVDSGGGSGGDGAVGDLHLAIAEHWSRCGRPSGPYSLVAQLASAEAGERGGAQAADGRARLSKRQRKDLKRGMVPAAASVGAAGAAGDAAGRPGLQGVAYSLPTLLLEAVLRGEVLAVAVADPPDHRLSLLQALA